MSHQLWPLIKDGTMTTAASGEVTTGVRSTEQAAHTPGPWMVEYDPHGYPCSIAAPGDNGVKGAVGRVVRRWGVGFPSSPTAAANARLIAAAPDMLAALRNVQKLISEAALTGFNPHDGDWPDRLFHSQQMTSAAIAKATGTEPANRDA